MMAIRTRGLGLYAMALTLACWTFSTLSPAAATEPTEAPMKVARMVSMNMTGSDENGMPESIRLQFSVDEDMVTLNLTSNKSVKSKAPVYVGRDNGVVEKMDIDLLDKFAVYTDSENSASFLYRTHHSEDGSSKKKFTGSFRMGNEDYKLEPATSAQHERVRRGVGDRAESGETYIVYPDAVPPVYDGDYLDRREEENPSSQFARELVEYYQAPPSNGKQIYFVETLFILDYGMYNRWWNLAHSSDSYSRDIETINNIRYYFTHVANGVDMRYRSIEESDYAITVKLIGFYIAATPSAARWSEAYREYDGQRLYVEAYKMLDDIIKWIDGSQRDGKLPNFDQATMFTGYNLFNDYNRDGRRRTINGLADIEGVCSKYKVSVNVDKGSYAATQTSTHEMGHGLGAIHDGPNNNCESRDQYIMAISPGGLTSRNFDNVFRFSPCSRHEIRLHLTYLRMQGKNCLMNPAENADQAEIDAHLERLPGQMFSPDDQCRYAHGPNGYYCGGQVADEGICHALVCYNPITRKCSSSVEQRAANGTTCGDRKWCKFGKCVTDAGAPEAEAYCASGDWRDVLSDKTRCEDIHLTTWKCYLEHFREPCCASCLAAKDESNPRCRYGDKVSWCHNIRRADCYNTRTREQCCQTCADHKSDKFNRCEYGDRATWCNNMKISSCYANGQTCCESCGQLQEENDRTGRYPTNCAFGDRASWCTDHRSRPWQCYISSHTCCATCNDAATGIPGCEYGDKMSGCYNADCTDYYYQRRCCATCIAYNGLTRPPPTTRRTPTPRPTTTTTTTPRPTPRPTTKATTRRTTTPRRAVTTVGPNNPVQKCIMQGRDLATWCQDRNLFKGICYTSAHICCVTCAMADRGTEECRYGDKISWCPQIDPGACYKTKTEEQCCDTCDRHRNDNRPECRYGDQYKWCRSESSRCNEADIREKCCHTCAGYKSTTTTTTTKATSTTTTTTTTLKPGATADPSTTSSTTTPSTTTTTTSTTTTTPSTTTPVRVTVSPIECPDGDSASWCPTIPSSYCYSSEHTCCATCQKRLISNDNECRYGDRFTWCAKLSPTRCSEEGIRRDCCLLCTEQKTSGFNPPPPCREDKAGWCVDIHHRECYQASTSETCCKTCQDHKVDVQGCEYGDCAEWCSSDLASYECYKFGETCCDTCGSLYSTGVTGCEYGDKTPVCEGLDCTDLQIRDLCCETCAKQAKVTVAVVTTTPTPEPEDAGCIEDSVTWCGTIKPQHCYADGDVCCRTCLKFYLGFRGCEYGDRVSWCRTAVTKAADCERADIGDNCCYTCALMGTPSTRENPEEWREGVLVGFLKEDMSKIIAEEMDMLMFLSHQVNEFCLDHPNECCLHLYDSLNNDKTSLAIPEIHVDEIPTPKQRQNLRIVLPSDCHIAGGYPRHSENNEGEIVTKYLVKLRPEALEPLCGGPQGHDTDKTGRRSRRDADKETRETTIYFNKHKLREMIVHNKDIIESAMGVQISRVALSGELQSPGFKVVVGIAAGAILAFIMVAIVLVIVIRKLLKMKKENEKPGDKKELYPPSTLFGFRPGKNKVRHWDQMSGSLSSFASTGMSSPVYVANEKLHHMPYITASRNYVTDSGKDLCSEPSSGTLTSPSPPPPYHATPKYGSDNNVGWTNQRHTQHDAKHNDIESGGHSTQTI